MTDTPLFPDFLRPMRADESAQVAQLLEAAFDGPSEAQLVEALRRDDAMAGEMVLPLGADVVGYYALSRFVEPEGWLCLAPVAVRPDMQGRNFGKRMMGQLVRWAEETGTPVVVLGQPEFYRSAGFSSEKAARLGTPYGTEYTMIAGVDEAPEAALVYPKAFEGV